MGRGSEEGERPVSEGSTWIEAAPEYGVWDIKQIMRCFLWILTVMMS